VNFIDKQEIKDSPIQHRAMQTVKQQRENLTNISKS
jgi:hypothetical protein